jgi:hypothetical protein
VIGKWHIRRSLVGKVRRDGSLIGTDALHTPEYTDGENSDTEQVNTPRRYPCFDVMVGLVWSHDPKSYAGSSLCYW